MADLFKKIYVGKLSKYVEAKEAKKLDDLALYMMQDENTGVKSMYKGDRKVAGDFIIVYGAAPETPEEGVIYYISEFASEEGAEGKPYVGFWDGEKWVALSDSATIDALDERITALEEWKEETPFVIWDYSTEERKHIVLNNHDSILGVGTDNVPYNLAMVSKWDVADFGSASLPMNLNSKDGVVTINDNDPKKPGSGIVAKLSDVNSAVESLDVDDTEEEGSVVVAVSQEDGLVSNVKKAVAVTKQATPSEGQQVTYDVTIGETSVGKIDIPFCDAVLSNAVLTDMEATVDPKTGEITAGDPKGADALGMVFKKADGTYTLIKVNISTILTEAEFKSGLAVSENGEVSVNLVSGNDYLKFGTPSAEDKNAPLEANVVALADAKDADEEAETPKVTGLADALDVKKEIAKAVADKNVDAAGDEYVSATAANNKVTVAATEKTQNAVALAETSVQSVFEAVEDQEVTVVVEDIPTEEGELPAGKKVTIGVTKAAYTKATEEADGKFTAEGLVDSALLKDYVADEIAKNAVYWEYWD